MALTERQEAYAQAVADGCNPIDAAKKAGYKATAASKQAARMATNENVKARIAELQAIKLVNASESERQAILGKPTNLLQPSQADLVNKKLSALDFLHGVYSDVRQPLKMRIQAATAALPYQEAKMAQVGKKEEAKERANQQATSGRFAGFDAQVDLFDVVN